MVEETVWVEKKYVRPRLSPDELLLIYHLIDSQYWLLRKHPRHHSSDSTGTQSEQRTRAMAM
jgi:hypothetical protein